MRLLQNYCLSVCINRILCNDFSYLLNDWHESLNYKRVTYFVQAEWTVIECCNREVETVNADNMKMQTHKL